MAFIRPCWDVFEGTRLLCAGIYLDRVVALQTMHCDGLRDNFSPFREYFEIER